MRNNESGFIPFYLHFLPQVVNFNNKGTNHGPHDPKKEQDKSDVPKVVPKKLLSGLAEWTQSIKNDQKEES